MRQLETEIYPPGGHARQRYLEAVRALPEIEPLERWVVMVAHEAECPSSRGAVALDALDACTCEVLHLEATTKRMQSLDEALKDPEFMLGLFKDNIVTGYYEGDVNPVQEEPWTDS